MAGQPAAPPRVLLYLGQPSTGQRPLVDAPEVYRRHCDTLVLDAGDVYATPCPQDSIMPPMQSLAVRQTHNNFSEVCESECDKGYANYQLVEQGVNIVSQAVTEEAQLVRTAEGVLLAVLPETPQPVRTVTVPLGWKRVISGSTVIYFSPSGTPLGSLPQVKDYLQTEGTCKCGLPCPLRPEIAFSFDPKVTSKPYVAASGAELTKLCNHKRKLLATLQARAQLYDHNKGLAEAGVVKKKMKKRAGFPAANMSPQLVVQRDRPLQDMKGQEAELKRTISPGMSFRNQYMPPYTPVQHNSMQDEPRPEHFHKGSHYLTVSSGWITQNDSPEPKQTHPNTPVFGNNGQIIGVNTGYKPVKNTIYTEHPKEHKPNVPIIKKEEESQIFCGLNQALTPEVMQKINEQQQIFIQQNQKQIEMAMKGFRTQMNENHNKQQFLPQGQLVIQNGAVVKANTAKTPPWQVKKNDSITSPSPTQRTDMECDDTNTNMSEDSSSSYGSFHSNEMNQAMCSRVPPLPQQYNMVAQQWPAVDVNKKKARINKGGRKKASPENKSIPFANNLLIDSKATSDNVPSFMDDPSGYLAQQTVLLNSTISRQVGINHTFDNNQYDGSSYLQDKSKLTNKSCEVPMYRHNVMPNSSPSPSNTPDSSVLSDKQTNKVQCCHGCNASKSQVQGQEHVDQMRLKYMRPNVYKLELDNRMDDNPVTSSTFVDRSPMHEGCGPIQAGTVSTSNVSETLLPEPSPTLSNSSRNTDTPHSGNSNQHHAASPMNSNPSTPGGHGYPYSSPGPPSTPGNTQIMHFISNHNVNKNLMEVDNIAMAVKPIKQDSMRKRDNAMPGYCPPPHLGGGPAHSLVNSGPVQTFVTTMASGFSVTRNTVTSVLAGRSSTATTSINSSQANYNRLPPPPCVNMATSYAIPNNQPDPFIDAVNIPTSYPLHIAGTTAQHMITRSPLEMVQHVINNVTSKTDTNASQANARRTVTTPGQILISSTGQIIVSNNQMPPPPPKTSNTSTQNNVSAVPTTASQMPMNPTMVVNHLPSPFVIQPPIIEGQVQQNQAMAQMIGVPNSPNSPRQGEAKFVQMLSPESLKKRAKKKKVQANITNVLQISPPQQNANLIVHHSPQNTSPQFSPRGFQLSPNNISPTGMLQALTIVPGKSGAPAQIVMNGQSGSGFGSQQIITNNSQQQINLLQPVNLINNGSGVVPNFQAFQQFILPNIGGMMMADGTAIIQDSASGMPVQLQLQTVNGQNVLTPVQNPGVFNGNNGVVLRANQQGKVLQSQHSPQFLSPNSQVVMSSPNFNGQLSPLLANLSPPNVTFNSQRPPNLHAQEFIQTNQMGQTLMVPISPKAQSNRNNSNSTFVQNTTIVQQQAVLTSHTSTVTNQSNRLNIDPNALTKRRFLELPDISEDNSKPFSEMEVDNAMRLMNDFAFNGRQVTTAATQTLLNQRGGKSPGTSGPSPPDTTTHSPLGPLEPLGPLGPSSPRVGPARCLSTQANYADTTTKSPEPADASSQAMVQCVSSSEQDMSPELWPADITQAEDNNMISNAMLPPNRTSNEPTVNNHYAQNTTNPAANQHMLPISSNYYDRPHAYKRKNEFGESAYRPEKMMRSNMVHIDSEYDHLGLRQMRSYQHSDPSSDMHKVFERRSLDHTDDATTPPPSANSENNLEIKIDAPEVKDEKIEKQKEDKVAPKAKEEKQKEDKVAPKAKEERQKEEKAAPKANEERQKEDKVVPKAKEERQKEDKVAIKDKDDKIVARKFDIGDLIWGPVKGYASWPGKLVRREEGDKWRVRWFGPDKPPGSVEDSRLLTLSEGLEAHHAARTKHRKSRKLNTLLENAIQEAMSELDKTSDSDHPADGGASASQPAITDTPKRKKEKKEKKSPAKIALKIADGSKLRRPR